LSTSINHWFIKTGDKPQPLNTVDNKIATTKRKIMHTKFGDSRFSRSGDMIAGI